RHWYRLSTCALVVAAWAALAAWGASPYASLLDHRATVGDAIIAPARTALFVVGWTLMTIAMMLPSSLPLVNLFRRLTLQRADRGKLLMLLLLGYLGIWAYFGLLALLADGALHMAVDRLDGIRGQETRLIAAVLLLAGIYQFTPLKRLCLDKCR